jgi:hypothetical protein
MAALGKKAAGRGGGTAGAKQNKQQGRERLGPQPAKARPGGGRTGPSPGGEGQTAIMAIVDRESQQQTSKAAGGGET